MTSPLSRVALRYLAFQVPGWAVASVLAWVATRWLELPVWAGPLAVAAWIAKDVVLFPYVRRAYEDGPDGDHRISVGDFVVAVDALSPEGFVRAGSELWHAELALGTGPVAKGDRVRVRAVVGLRLVVEPAVSGASSA